MDINPTYLNDLSEKAAKVIIIFSFVKKNSLLSLYEWQSVPRVPNMICVVTCFHYSILLSKQHDVAQSRVVFL